MDDHLRMCKPYWFVTSHPGQLYILHVTLESNCVISFQFSGYFLPFMGSNERCTTWCTNPISVLLCRTVLPSGECSRSICSAPSKPRVSWCLAEGWRNKVLPHGQCGSGKPLLFIWHHAITQVSCFIVIWLLPLLTDFVNCSVQFLDNIYVNLMLLLIQWFVSSAIPESLFLWASTKVLLNAMKRARQKRQKAQWFMIPVIAPALLKITSVWLLN